MPQKQKFTNQQYLNIYNRNLNDKQTAEILNVSHSAIAQRRYKLKLMPKHPNRKSNPELNYRNLRDAQNKGTAKYRLKNPEKIKQTQHNNFKQWQQTPISIIARRKASKKYGQKPETKKLRRIDYQINYHKKHPNAKYRKQNTNKKSLTTKNNKNQLKDLNNKIVKIINKETNHNLNQNTINVTEQK